MTRPPGPVNLYPAQHVLRLQRDLLGYMTELGRTYPDVCRLTGFQGPIWILQQPELVGRLLTGHPSQFEKGHALQRARILLGNGLLTAEGDDHLNRRRMVQPTFHKDRISAYAETMVECAVEQADRMVGVVDIHRSMMDLALEIVSRTLLGTRLTEDHQIISRSLDTVLGKFRYLMLPFFSYLTRLPFGPVRHFEKARQDLFEVIEKVLAHPAEGSLVEMLIESQVDQETVRDEILTMLLAGHETTANALTFALDLLARHPDKAQQMRAELDRVLGGRLPSAADYRDLIYTRHVLEETLRLYPPAWAVGRKTLVDLDWDPYPISRGSILIAPQWLLHRDPRYFEDPLTFRPERWEEERPAKFTYFPFGGGTRICIGEGFARMEAVLVLAVLGQRFQFGLINPEPLQLTPGVTLRPPAGFKLLARPVTQKPVSLGVG